MEAMKPDKSRKTLVLAIRHAFAYIAFWQVLSFLILVLLVWANELLDFAHLFWGAPRSPFSLMRGCLATAGVLLGLVVTIGNTYLQQRSIVSGMLTICSYCHKIRIDQDLWQRIEQYVTKSSGIMLSHGVCPECYDKVMQSIEQEEAEAETPVSPAVPAANA
ncbi:MAG: hypothetical protein JXB13_05700 [Phycisphaerae bacterium]|nr:hypothetical protein [Phycisphaerae bacterium]